MAENTMQLTELIRSLRQLQVETGSLACLGCAESRWPLLNPRLRGYPAGAIRVLIGQHEQLEARP